MNSTALASDILERQFGPTRIEVLYQKDKTRIICTKVIPSGQILELSLVTFIQPGIKRYPDIHSEVKAGQSIGKAFRAAGIAFEREIKSSYLKVLPKSFIQLFGSADPANVINVTILVGQQKTPYAHIFETYSPKVKWPKLIGQPSDRDLNKINRLNLFLTKKFEKETNTEF